MSSLGTGLIPGCQHFWWSEWSYPGRRGEIVVPARHRPNVMELALNLEKLRRELGDSPIVSLARRAGGWRPRFSSVGATLSMHKRGKALDFRVPGWDLDDVARIIDRMMEDGTFKKGGLHVYHHRNFIHVDIGGRRRYWDDSRKVGVQRSW